MTCLDSPCLGMRTAAATCVDWHALLSRYLILLKFTVEGFAKCISFFFEGDKDV